LILWGIEVWPFPLDCDIAVNTGGRPSTCDRRRSSTSNSMDCCAGVTASSSGVRADDQLLLELRGTLGIVELVVRVDTARSTKSSDVNSTWQEVASTFQWQICGKVSQRVDSIMTRVNRTTPDNVPSYRLQLARPRQPNCLDRFEIDHAFYLTHAQTPAACKKTEPSSIYRVAVWNEQERNNN